MKSDNEVAILKPLPTDIDALRASFKTDEMDQGRAEQNHLLSTKNITGVSLTLK